jgi:hypothetical protein
VNEATITQVRAAEARTTEALLALHQEVDGTGPARISFRTWTPHSERKQRQRLFVESTVDGTARYVAKVPLDPRDDMVDREWLVLSTLRGLEAVRPAPVRRLGRGFVMTYVPERDFPDVMGGRGPAAWPELLGRAVDLAAALHAPAAGRHPAPHDRAVEVAAAYLPGLAGVSEATIARLDGATTGPTHGDLGPWNVRVDAAGRVSLVDWEDYRAVGLPWLDVLNLVLTAALIAFPDYRQCGFDRLYDRVFHEQNAFRRTAVQALARYASRTGASVAAIVGLTPLFCRWMIRRIADQGRPTDHLYYGRFAERFEAEPPHWARRSR